jgi:ribonuclease T2
MTGVACLQRRIALFRKIPAQIIVLLVLFGLFFSSCSGPQSQPHENSTPRSQSAESPNSRTQPMGNSASGFDYYLLAVSWAPQFCAKSERNSSQECDPSRHYGLVVHGLWPQNDDGSYPEKCEQSGTVSNETARQVLPIMPSRGLIQHEWAEHGSCTGLDAQTYFGELQQAFSQLQIPSQYRSPAEPARASPAEIEQEFADANHAPVSAFRVACSGGEFSGIDVCLTKKLEYRGCGAGVRECRSRMVAIRPVL